MSYSKKCKTCKWWSHTGSADSDFRQCHLFGDHEMVKVDEIHDFPYEYRPPVYTRSDFVCCLWERSK